MAARVHEQSSDRLPAPAWPVLELLACPVCHGSLAPAGADVLACSQCGSRWPERDGWLDFVAGAELPLDDHWVQRQQSMEAWYGNLITASDQAEECHRHDYEPLAPLLGGPLGLVLDVGGETASCASTSHQTCSTSTSTRASSGYGRTGSKSPRSSLR
jgi:hypothetical protein